MPKQIYFVLFLHSFTEKKVGWEMLGVLQVREKEPQAFKDSMPTSDLNYGSEVPYGRTHA